MAKNTIPTIASVGQSLKSAGRLVAKQAEQTKLAQFTLPSAFAELGKATYEDGSRRGEFAELFAALDALVAQKAHTEEGRRARPSAEKLFEKAKKAALDAGDIARGKAEDFQISRAAAALGEAVYSRAESAGVNEALSGRISSLKASLAALDEEIKTLADSKLFGQVSMKKALLGVAGACVAMTLLWVVMPRRTQPRAVTEPSPRRHVEDNRQKPSVVPSPMREDEPVKISDKSKTPTPAPHNVPMITSAYVNENGKVVVYKRPDPAYEANIADQKAERDYQQAAVRVATLTGELRTAEIRGSGPELISRLRSEVSQAEMTQDQKKKQLAVVRAAKWAKEDQLTMSIEFWQSEKHNRDVSGRKFISLEEELASDYRGNLPPWPLDKQPPIPSKDEYRAFLKNPEHRVSGPLLCAMERLLRSGSTLQTENSRDLTMHQMVFYHEEDSGTDFWEHLGKEFSVIEGASKRSYLSVWKQEVLKRSRVRVSLEALQLNFGPTAASPLKSHGDAFSEQSVQELKAECGEDLKEMPFECVDGVVYFFGTTKDEKEFPELGKTRVELLGSLTIVNK